VWLAILLLLASGYWMLFTTFGGFAGAGLHIQLMQLIGWLMIALFVWLFHGPWLALKRAVDAENWPTPAPASTASAGSSLSIYRSACSLLSSALAGATGGNSSLTALPGSAAGQDEPSRLHRRRGGWTFATGPQSASKNV
jgi:hypothetical protein